MITNLSVRLENFFSLVNDPEQIHFIGSRDPVSNNYRFLINTGTMLLRNSGKALEMINYALRLHDEIPHIRRNLHHEQDAMVITVLERFYNHTVIFPLCLLQSMWSVVKSWYQWQPGHFAMHQLAMDFADRTSTFQALHVNASQWWKKNRSHANMNCTDETL